MTSPRTILSEEALSVAEFMSPYRGLWHFSGGWAIDLFCGARRRHHKDVDIAVLRSEQRLLWRHLKSRSPLKLVNKHLSAWRANEALIDPVFQVFAKSPTLDLPDWEYLLEDGSRIEWVCRRDPNLRLPYHKAYWTTPGGIPYLAPEIVLLFKAKHTMPSPVPATIPEELGRLNDEEDFQSVLPLLSPEQSEWLAHALASTHPGHPWLRSFPAREPVFIR